MVLAVLPAIIDGFGHIPWLFALGLLGALCVVDIALTARPAQLTAQWSAPTSAALGAPIDCSVTIRLPRLIRSMRFDALIETGQTVARHSPVSFLLRNANPPALALPLMPLRRGPAQIDAIRLRWSGPLGLIEWQRRLELDTEIAVTLPSLRQHRPTAQLLLKTTQMGMRIERYRGQGTEFEALDVYTPDHDYRRIDWKASARRTTPLVRQYRAERNRDVVFAIDTGHLMAQPLADMPRLDHAILAAQLLALAATRTGDRVGLFAFDSVPRAFVRPAPGTAAYFAFTRTTATLHDSIQETNFTRCMADLSGRLKRRSLVVVLTDFVDATTAEIMLEHLERIGKKNVLLFAVLRDPVLDEARTQRPSDLRSVHAAVTADALTQDRERVFARLRRGGAIVVEGTPESLAAQMLTKYLEIKRREQL